MALIDRNYLLCTATTLELSIYPECSHETTVVLSCAGCIGRLTKELAIGFKQQVEECKTHFLDKSGYDRAQNRMGSVVDRMNDLDSDIESLASGMDGLRAEVDKILDVLNRGTA